MLRHFEFSQHQSMSTGPFAQHRIIDVLNVLGFYVEPVSVISPKATVLLRPVLPRYVLMWLRNEGGLEYLEAQGGDVLVLLALMSPHGALDQGRFFELLLARRLATRLNSPSVALFPGDNNNNALAGTMLKGMLAALQKHPQRALFAVQLHGGETPAKTKSKLELELSKNLDAFIPRDTVVLGRVSSARFVDVFVRLLRAKDGDGSGGGDHFLGVAGKNYQSEDGLSWTDVQKEIDVFEPVLVRLWECVVVCALPSLGYVLRISLSCCSFRCRGVHFVVGRAGARHGDADRVQHAAAKSSC
jgi:hypothetical protein